MCCRYLAIRNPHTYRNRFTTKRVLLTVGCIWLISLTVPFVYYEVGYITYAFIFANTAIVLAIAITVFTYALMLNKFKQRSRNTEESVTIANNGNKTDTMASTRPANAVTDSAAKWEQKITKMFMVVLIALLCCYGPSTVFIYSMSFCERCSCRTLHWFRDLQFLFVIMNSSVNFYCYALRSPRFRNAFAVILRIKSREDAEPISYSGTRGTTASGNASANSIDTRI